MKKFSVLTLGVLAVAGISSAQVKINAAGATFPNPIYSKWFSEFAKDGKVQINYQSVGSGAGIAQLTAGTVDFGASDKPMSDQQLAKVKVKTLHFPTVMGAVVATYNVPGLTGDLKLTGDVLANIFLGKITKWNDKAIAALNAGARLPDQDIIVVHRSDGSGTTFVFTDYLSKVSPEWASKVKADASVNWPTGLGAKGNDGVAGQVKQTPGAIGYVELIYAIQTRLGYATLRNADGQFVKASLQSVSAAAAGAAASMPGDFRVSITNARGAGSYPISTFTWLLIPSQIPDAAKRDGIKSFLKWMLTTGQAQCASLDFAPLPKQIVAKEMKQLDLIK